MGSQPVILGTQQGDTDASQDLQLDASYTLLLTPRRLP